MRTDGEEWMLDPDHYDEFLRAATGVEPSDDDPCPSGCYRVGNRLEAFIEERKRRGEWGQEVVDEYPVVESTEEIIWVARFFRECHRCHLPI